MSAPTPARPRVLLLHEGELDELRDLLRSSGVPLAEAGPAEPEPGAWTGIQLVVGSGSLLLEGTQTAPQGATTLALLDEESRLLRAALQERGVDYVVARPVEPRMLQLLVQRLLYGGPERRGAERVSVGTPVQLRIGLRRRPAVLVDLSPIGCSLLAPHSVRFGRPVAVGLPPHLAGGADLWLRGRVARVGPPGSDEPGVEEIGVRFRALLPVAQTRLADVMRALGGRAPAEGAGPAPSGEEPVDRAVRAVDDDFDVRWMDSLERRGHARRPYPRRVIAKGEGFANVVIARDLSLGGMRIEPTTSLFVGDSLQVALYAQSDRAPLVLTARVTRDDGAQGLVLAFSAVSGAAESYLNGILEALPNLERLASDGPAQPLFVSELLPA